MSFKSSISSSAVTGKCAIFLPALCPFWCVEERSGAPGGPPGHGLCLRAPAAPSAAQQSCSLALMRPQLRRGKELLNLIVVCSTLIGSLFWSVMTSLPVKQLVGDLGVMF